MMMIKIMKMKLITIMMIILTDYLGWDKGWFKVGNGQGWSFGGEIDGLGLGVGWKVCINIILGNQF